MGNLKKNLLLIFKMHKKIKDKFYLKNEFCYVKNTQKKRIKHAVVNHARQYLCFSFCFKLKNTNKKHLKMKIKA